MNIKHDWFQPLKDNWINQKPNSSQPLQDNNQTSYYESKTRLVSALSFNRMVRQNEMNSDLHFCLTLFYALIAVNQASKY